MGAIVLSCFDYLDHVKFALKKYIYVKICAYITPNPYHLQTQILEKSQRARDNSPINTSRCYAFTHSETLPTTQ